MNANFGVSREAAIAASANLFKALTDGQRINKRSFAQMVRNFGILREGGEYHLPLKWVAEGLEGFSKNAYFWAVLDSCGGVKINACGADFLGVDKPLVPKYSTSHEVSFEGVPREVWRDMYLFIVGGTPSSTAAK